ncbi:MAG: glycosyltransferase [Candidatus Micrarchaeota archaeon]|nr:glycosyltransferase [Candidatus Micrarchaeota archaeon]
MKICVIIPAYNEEARIGKTLEEYSGSLLRRYGKRLEILVVSESRDGTNAIVRSYSRKNKCIRLMAFNERLLKGGAVLKGFEYACSNGFDIIGFADADLAVSGDGIGRLLRHLRSPNVDGVIASRYVEGSRILGRQSIMRYVGSRGYNILLRILFGFSYHDTQCGYKFFKKDALCKVMKRLVLTDMSFDLNLLHELGKSGAKIIEAPVVYRMGYEGSKVRVKRQLPQMLLVAFGYRIVRSPVRHLVPAELQRSIYRGVKRL